MSQSEDVTALLERIKRREPDAREALVRVVENRLRHIAQSYLRRERPDHTLQATVLVDDACLQLLGDAAKLDWENRAHFYRAAARAMRHILIDHERGKQAAKRPPRRLRQPLEGEPVAALGPAPIDVLALHEALEKLAKLDPRQSEVVELHHFGGYTLEETARMLDVSLSTAKAEWTFAKAWLHRELSQGDTTT